LWLIPDNWYGGSGTIGNRYFLNLLPLAAFLVPVGRARWVAVLGALIALPALLALFAAPMDAALRPGQHAMRAPFRWLPAELTMLNDLSIFGEPRRKKQPVGDVGGGDPRNPRPAQAGAHFLYFTDDGTYGREERDGRAGFRVKAGQTAEVLVRALYPVARVRARLSAGGAGDRLTVRLGWRSQEAVVSAGETREVVLEPSSRGVVYKETFVHVMRFRSLRSGAPGADDTFVQLVLDDAPGD
jgi:hypothetical protein